MFWAISGTGAALVVVGFALMLIGQKCGRFGVTMMGYVLDALGGMLAITYLAITYHDVMC